MMRAFLNTIGRNLIVAGLIATISGLGGFGVNSPASARSYPKNQIQKTVVFKKKLTPLKSFSSRKNLRYKRRKKPQFQNHYVKNLYQKRRKKNSRKFNKQKPRSAVSSGKAASLGTVARRVRQRVPGQLLDARLMKDRRGKLTYRLKILGRNGVMRNVTADAYTGAILGIR